MPRKGHCFFVGGELGIRTPGGFNTSTVFKTAAIDRSANSPGAKVEHLALCQPNVNRKKFEVVGVLNTLKMNRFYFWMSCILFRKSGTRLSEFGFLRHFFLTCHTGSKGF